MQTRDISHILLRRIQAVEAGLSGIRQEMHQETIHDFRVAYKKMRALARLLNSEKHRIHRIRFHSTLKEIYHLTGEIRNSQLHRQYLDQWCLRNKSESPRTYIACIDNQLAVHRARLSYHLLNAPVPILDKSVGHYKPLTLSARECVNYFERQIEAVHSEIPHTFLSDDSMHRLRKVIKDLSYNRKYFYSYHDQGCLNNFADGELIDAVAVDLGNFHDLCVCRQYLQYPFVPGGVKPEEELVLRKVVLHVDKEYELMRKELANKIAAPGSWPVIFNQLIMKNKVINNKEKNRFEIQLDEGSGVLEYRLDGNSMSLMHTEVSDRLEGRGIGSELAAYALQYARDHDIHVKVYCPFVRKFLERHPEFAP